MTRTKQKKLMRVCVWTYAFLVEMVLTNWMTRYEILLSFCLIYWSSLCWHAGLRKSAMPLATRSQKSALTSPDID